MSETADALAQPVSDFLARIADPIPAPGGGSAAAVAVAMAAALVRSVASVSRAGWDEAGGVAAQADAISHRVAPLIELDARRYEEALRLLAERGSIAAEERDLRLGAALEGAAAPPLEIGEAAADVAELAALAAAHGEHAVRADAVSAATLAEAAGEIAVALVEINLATARDDPRTGRARKLLARATRARERAAAAITT